MDREGFRNRMKQYKKAREENPGLKYWEWKAIPKYAGGGEVGKEYYGNKVSTEDNPIYYKEQTAKEKYSDFVNKYGWTNIDALNARNTEASKYTIPYIPEKEIRLTTDRYNTGKISTNLLDSIYDSSQRVGIPFDVALGLAGRESTLGIGRGFKKGSDITMTDLYSNWQQVQPVIASKSMTDKWNDLVRKEKRGEPLTDDDYAFRTEFLEFEKRALESTKPIKEHPIDNALKLYLTGRYNMGDKSYEQKVQKDAQLVMSDPAIQKWAKEKGIAYAEGGQVEPDPLEVLERSKPRVAGIPINDKPLSGTDPIGEAMMWGLGGGIASAALRSIFPTYGATAAWLAFGDNNKNNMLVVPNSSTRNTTPIETGLLNKEVRQYYADDVLPRDILTSEADKLKFLNTDKNFEYDLYPQAYFSNGVAGHYDRLDDKIRLNGGYTSNKDLLDNVMAHEVNHRYNREFPLDKEHNRILNRAYTVQSDLDTRAARAARKPSEKRATNVNIRHRLQTDLRNTLGHNPTKAEMDKFIDSLSDQELLDRLGSASSYGSAYLMSIEDRADLVKQPADQYKKARTTTLRKALKRIAMSENKNGNNQNYA